MQGKITLSAVKAAKPKATPYFLWDEQVPGFGLQVRPNGKMSFVVKYRLSGRQKMLAIGPVGVFTPEKARDEALQCLSMARSPSSPTDPMERRRKDRIKGLTFHEVFEKYFAAQHPEKKASTLRSDRSRRKRLEAALGKKVVSVELKLDLLFQGPSATRLVGLLGGICTWAIAHGHMERNPTAGFKRKPARKIERYLDGKELAAIGLEMKSGKHHPTAVAALKFLMLTGLRLNEALTLQWDEVDAIHNAITLHDSKTGGRVVPIGTTAMALLKAQPRIKGNPHCFPGVHGTGHFIGLRKIWLAILKAAKVRHARIHDLRHNLASHSVSGGGASLPLIGKILGHKNTKTTERYAHMAPDPVRLEVDRVSGALDKMLGS